jgi:hypothetical protein
VSKKAVILRSVMGTLLVGLIAGLMSGLPGGFPLSSGGRL